jgi:carbon storage regulator
MRHNRLMLMLMRRPGERVVIGDDVIIDVVEISGQNVRLGIAAPHGLPVYREEIWLSIKEQNRAAADAGADALPGAPADGHAPAGAKGVGADSKPS